MRTARWDAAAGCSPACSAAEHGHGHRRAGADAGGVGAAGHGAGAGLRPAARGAAAAAEKPRAHRRAGRAVLRGAGALRAAVRPAAHRRRAAALHDLCRRRGRVALFRRALTAAAAAVGFLGTDPLRAAAPPAPAAAQGAAFAAPRGEIRQKALSFFPPQAYNRLVSALRASRETPRGEKGGRSL